jgi:glutamyl-tRNA synthetase
VLTIIQCDVESNIRTLLNGWQENQIIALIELYKQRAKTLREIVDELLILYKKDVSISQEDKQQWLTPESLEHLKQVIDLFSSIEPFEAETISTTIKNWCKDRGIKIVSLAQPIRLALTGKTTSPGVFDLLAILGKRETFERLDEFLKRS